MTTYRWLRQCRKHDGVPAAEVYWSSVCRVHEQAIEPALARCALRDRIRRHEAYGVNRLRHAVVIDGTGKIAATGELGDVLATAAKLAGGPL